MDRDFIINEIIERFDKITLVVTHINLDLLSECTSEESKKKNLVESLDKIENITKEIRNLI